MFGDVFKQDGDSFLSAMREIENLKVMAFNAELINDVLDVSAKALGDSDCEFIEIRIKAKKGFLTFDLLKNLHSVGARVKRGDSAVEISRNREEVLNAIKLFKEKFDKDTEIGKGL
jgi:hypothetical protein